MADPRITLETVVQTAIDTSLKEVHTCLPAIVETVNSDQTLDVQPTIQRRIDGVDVNLPLLVGVPLRFFKSGEFSISFPIKKGDHVLVLFSERSIDNWLLDGDIRPAGDVRRHSLSDGIALPMAYPQTDLIGSFDTTNLEIKSTGGASIKLTPGGDIQLNGDADYVTAFNDMKTAFDQLRQDFNALVTQYNLHIHVTTATDAGGSLGVISPTVAQGTSSTADMSSAQVTTVKVP